MFQKNGYTSIIKVPKLDGNNMIHKFKSIAREILRNFNIEIIKSSTLENIYKMLSDQQEMLAKDLNQKTKNAPMVSQLNQDLFALVINDYKTNGYFVEFGATNGKTLSNTYNLEKHYQWTGILAEPSKHWHDDLAKNRNVIIDHRAVYSKTGETIDFLEVLDGELSTIEEFQNSDHHDARRLNANKTKVETVTLEDLLDQHKSPNVIDYLSLDTQGSEYEIIKDFPFGKYQFRCISVEHNYTKNREQIYKLLSSKGYTRKYSALSQWDDWYVLETITN